jgi:hypothetical protein
VLPIGAIALNILKTLSFPVRSGSQKYRLLTKLKEKYCVYTDYLAAAKDLDCGSVSTVRVLVSWNLSLEPFQILRVTLYCIFGCEKIMYVETLKFS